jgi:uncharacterized protein
MTREQLILAAMATADRPNHMPVQLQKLFFLIDRRMPKAVDGPHFDFQPYHYGPFDRAVFDVLEKLAAKGLVEVERQSDRRWKKYRLTEQGQERGAKILKTLQEPTRTYLERLSRYVRSMSFPELVSAIYDAYPEMKVNSVFAG